MRIYVAAPYDDAELVRGVHARLRAMGCTPTSQWASKATAPEDFGSMTPEEISAVAKGNDRDVLSSEMVLVIARAGAGGEMFAEARFASCHSVPIVWVGRLTLSAWRKGVTRCADLEEGMKAIRLLVGGP